VRTMATYRISAPDVSFSAEHVAAALEIDPSRSGWRHRPDTAVGQWSWASAAGPVDGAELSQQIAVVIDQLDVHRAALWSPVEDGYEMDWFCFLGSHATEHAAELPRELLQCLLDLPGTLMLDVYDDSPDD
jgi:hypothetical protein